MKIRNLSNGREKYETFIEYFYSTYAPHPFSRSKIIIDNKAVVELSYWDDTILINDIFSTERGGGRYAMNIICSKADEYGVVLSLYAKPLDSIAGKKMKKDELRNWYKQFGFDVEQELEDGYDMIRNPS